MARYENFILENKLKDQYETELAVVDFVTIDDGLVATPGMTKKVNVYQGSGEAQEVAEGEGNTTDIEMTYVPKEYKVGTTQARFPYTDEAEMTDPFLVDSGIKFLSVSLLNKLNAKVVAEYWNATKYKGYVKGTDTLGFDAFVDAIALLKKESEADAGLFALINPSTKAVLRKALKEDLKYVEAQVRTGYLGTVCGIPISESLLVPDDCVIIATRKAVTYFRKKTVEVEQDRDKNLRKNTVYGRQVDLVAFTDANECAIIAPNITAPTITTASIAAGASKEFKGACVAGATVMVTKNGVDVAAATVTDTAWTYTIPTATAGEVYNVRASKKGFAPKTAATGLTVGA